MYFNKDGTLDSRDGKAWRRSTFTVNKVGDGLLVESKYISDNNEPNCQGLSAQFVREHLAERFLIQFVDGTQKLRLHVGESEADPYFIAVRVE